SATLTASSSSFAGPLNVLAGGSLNTAGGTITFQSNLVIHPAASWNMDVNTTIVLAAPATNFGTMHWVSRNNGFNLQGSGPLENAGVWQVFADPSCPTCGSEGTVALPVN